MIQDTVKPPAPEEETFFALWQKAFAQLIYGWLDPSIPGYSESRAAMIYAIVAEAEPQGGEENAD